MTSKLRSLTTELTTILPESRQEMIAMISERLFGRTTIIDTHNTASVIFIFGHSGASYVLKAEYGGQTATTHEISWYKRALGRANSPKCLFSHHDEKFAFLILDYIQGALTLQDVMNSDNYTDKAFVQFIEMAITANRALFDGSDPVHADPDEVDTFYVEKFHRRYEEAKDTPYLKDLFDALSIKVNGVVVPTPLYYIEKIKSTPMLRNYLTPNKLGLIHGDLHCGNILVSNSDIFFIDPNGAYQMPLEYDYGKLLHSVHGGYGQIMASEYSLLKTAKDAYSYEVSRSTKQVASLEYLRSTFPEQVFLRSMYSEALHFATMLPHHAANQRETLALFLRSIQIFYELFNYESVRKKL